MKQLFFILFVLLPIPSFADYWNGTSSDKSWYDSSKDEFYINTASELKGLSDLVLEKNTFEGKTIHLMTDINLNFQQWQPIGVNHWIPFKGTFNGHNHKISNVLITVKNDNSINYRRGSDGLFGEISNALIMNLECDVHINLQEDATGSLGQNTGGLVGNCTSSAIENITISTIMTIGTDYSAQRAFLGGVVGYSSSSEIKNVLATGSISMNTGSMISIADASYIGGIAGFANSICQADSRVNISTGSYISYNERMIIGGIAGSCSNIQNVIYSGNLDFYLSSKIGDMAGGIAGSSQSINYAISCPTGFNFNGTYPTFGRMISPQCSDVQNAFYVDALGFTDEHGNSVSQDYITSGTVLGSFDTNIWKFRKDALPQIKTLIPKCWIETSTEHGIIGFLVEEGETAQIRINNDDGWEISSVFANDIDVTPTLESNYLSLKDVNENIRISIIYKATSGIKNNAVSNKKIRIEGKKIILDGFNDNTQIQIYDTEGKLLKTVHSRTFILNRGVYVLRVGKESYKISI